MIPTRVAAASFWFSTAGKVSEVSDTQSLRYHVELVIVIDVTGSMGHIIQQVK